MYSGGKPVLYYLPNSDKAVFGPYFFALLNASREILNGYFHDFIFFSQEFRRYFNFNIKTVAFKINVFYNIGLKHFIAGPEVGQMAAVSKIKQYIGKFISQIVF